MPLELLTTYLKLPVFALVAARLGGLLIFQPVLGALAVPVNLRVLLVLGLAALLTPSVPWPAHLPDTPLGLLLGMTGEVLLGGILGLAGVLCFMGLQWGGLMLAMESGLAYGRIVDPTSEEDETVLGVFYLQLAVVIYLIVGGHRALLSACLDTFQHLPLMGDIAAVQSGADLLLEALALSAQVALKVAAPALLALFLVNVALGFISRTMPQLNILAVGFSLKSLITFMLMAVSLPTSTEAFLDASETVYGWFNQLVGS